MDERKSLGRLLNKLESDLKQLEIRYEQYFAGIEKREPLKDREQLARQLRNFANRRIIQTDLRFRCQNLAIRFHTYGNYWDRILRLIEEGRYHRSRPPAAPSLAGQPPEAAPADPRLERVYAELLKIHSESGAGGPLPKRDKIAALLEQQSSRIREKFGDRDVEFHVTTENGKPKIKVRAKSS